MEKVSRFIFGIGVMAFACNLMFLFVAILRGDFGSFATLVFDEIFKFSVLCILTSIGFKYLYKKKK